MKAFSFRLNQDLEPATLDDIQKKAAGIARHGFIESRRRIAVFASRLDKGGLTGCAMVNPVLQHTGEVDSHVQVFLAALGLQTEIHQGTELNEESALVELFGAFRSGLVEETDSVLDAFGLLRLPGVLGEVRNIPRIASCEALFEKAQQFEMLPELALEVERIASSGVHSGKAGHPVHYILEMEPGQPHQEAVSLLLRSLYAQGRIQRSRYLTMCLPQDRKNDEMRLMEAAESSVGGALVMDFIPDENKIVHYIPSAFEAMNACHAILTHQQQVLFILCLHADETGGSKKVSNALPGVPFVLIQQKNLEDEAARKQLCQMAVDAGVQPDALLFDMLDQSQSGHSLQSLKMLFDDWYQGCLIRTVYPQYYRLDNMMLSSPAKKEETNLDCSRSDAYDTLQAMIGLSDAKNTIEQVLAARQASKLYTERGIKSAVLPMHLMFTGNPGTAKTSVARLYADILKERGILSRGDLFEVGRSDLVGKYVGWTARLVKDWFRKARGSVLFIDEAYALADGREGSFGQEAIDTLAQEMENNREDTLVILAGYPGKMEGLLAQNPGLRSRIGFHVLFEDYSPAQLAQILQLMATEKGLLLEQGLIGALEPLFHSAAQDPEFGNGRFVRNLLDKARLRQAQRLLHLPPDLLTDEQVRTLQVADFEKPQLQSQPRRQIGFQNSG